MTEYYNGEMAGSCIDNGENTNLVRDMPGNDRGNAFKGAKSMLLRRNSESILGTVKE